MLPTQSDYVRRLSFEILQKAQILSFPTSRRGDLLVFALFVQKPIRFALALNISGLQSKFAS